MAPGRLQNRIAGNVVVGGCPAWYRKCCNLEIGADTDTFQLRRRYPLRADFARLPMNLGPSTPSLQMRRESAKPSIRGPGRTTLQSRSGGTYTTRLIV